jgi:hypothetical protein
LELRNPPNCYEQIMHLDYLHRFMLGNKFLCPSFPIFAVYQNFTGGVEIG